MIEITVGLCESFKAIGIDISEADLRKFEQALYERGLNVAPQANPPPVDNLKEALGLACDRLELFVDTFGDMGENYSTKADINDWRAI